MKKGKIAALLLAGSALLAHSIASFATDISRDVRASGSGLNLENGGHFSLGFGVLAGRGTWQNKDESDTDRTYLGTLFIISGGYRYGGAFIEAEQGSLDGLNLGYTAWNNQAWSVDVLASVPGGNLVIGDDEYVVASSEWSEQRRNDNLLERLKKDMWLAGAGVRLTGYVGDYVVQARVLTDVHSGRGGFGSFRFGRSWQVKNWNLYGLASAEYYSKGINNDFFGVSADEATERFSEFQAEAGGRVSGKVGLTYPLGEHWIGEASALVQSLTSAEKNSPLMNDSNFHALSTLSMSYVF